MFSNQSLQKYLLSLAIVVGMSILVMQAPGLLLLVSDLVSPGDLSDRLRSWGRIGANKETALTVVLIVAGVVSVALAAIPKNFRALPFAIRLSCSAIVLAILISFLMTLQQARFFNEKQHDVLALQTVAYERLVMQQMRSPSGINETQTLILEYPPKDFEKLNGVIRDEFAKNLADLRDAWSGLDESALQAAYMMNVVSRLWAFGNEVNPERVGCALQNERTGFEPRGFDGLESFI